MSHNYCTRFFSAVAIHFSCRLIVVTPPTFNVCRSQAPNFPSLFILITASLPVSQTHFPPAWNCLKMSQALAVFCFCLSGVCKYSLWWLRPPLGKQNSPSPLRCCTEYKNFAKVHISCFVIQREIVSLKLLLFFQVGAAAEQEDNATEQRRQHGKKVLYGQIIQLRHVFSGKFVHISTTQTSRTETSNMQVRLQSFPLSPSSFPFCAHM